MTVTYPTALDRHCADLAATLAEITTDPTGPKARAVRDDLRRAHPRGVARNAASVAALVRALPPNYRPGLLSSACLNTRTYRRALAQG